MILKRQKKLLFNISWLRGAFGLKGDKMFVSEYYQLLNGELNDLGVFDALLDKDSNFFINVIRLKKTTVPEFQVAYRHLNDFFSKIATLLDNADRADKSDVMYRQALKEFTFHEVNGINLGLASSPQGAGWGPIISEQVLADAFQIIKKGVKQPELFHLVNLFESNVAGDRLSDMIATIIEDDIKKYTLRIQQTLGITPDTHPELAFDENGFVKNPYKKALIYLLPTEILHELPIARDWSDIDRVVRENEYIRSEVSSVVRDEWKKWKADRKKRYIRDHIFLNPTKCAHAIDAYQKCDLSAIDLRTNADYLFEVIMKQIRQEINLLQTDSTPNSLAAAHAIICAFKDWIENNRGWAVILDAPSRNREKTVQRCFHATSKLYVENNDLDISFEPDEGCGPADVKLSRGSDKSIIEVKLSTNGKYIQGYEEQIRRYGIAEHSENLIYVYIDLGHPQKLKKLLLFHEQMLHNKARCPELVIIDATKKKSASQFTSNVEHELSEMNIDLADFEVELDELKIELDDLKIEDFDIDSMGFDIDLTDDLFLGQ